jgi:hypothetical protein
LGIRNWSTRRQGKAQGGTSEISSHCLAPSAFNCPGQSSGQIAQAQSSKKARSEKEFDLNQNTQLSL